MIVARSCYSFLTGTSTPAALVARAVELKMTRLALADDESLAGAVPFWTACRSAGIKPILGARLGKTVWLARTREGYGNLCRLISARKLHRGHVDTSGLLKVENGTDAVFARKEEWRVHRLLSAIRENTLVAHVGNVASPEAYLRGDVGTTPDDERLAESCDWEFLPAPKIFPKNQGGMEKLRALCSAALPWRYPQGAPLERIERELGVIGKLGYADYFVVVHDIVRYSRERGLPVAGRGSGARARGSMSRCRERPRSSRQSRASR